MNRLPHVAMLNSFAGFGRISSTAALPVMNALKVKVSTMPTALLSSHLGYSPCAFLDTTSFMEDCAKAWQEIGASFDALHLGYLRNCNQIEVARKILTSPLNQKETKILLDPVMGDHGKVYSSVTNMHIEKMKELLPLADILTPNLTESCLLTNTYYLDKEWDREELRSICEKLDPTSIKQIVLTGIPCKKGLQNAIWDRGDFSILSFASAGTSRPGTGDIFAAIICALSVRGFSFPESVQKATDFISLCIAESDKAGIPVKEGILYETNLSYLISI